MTAMTPLSPALARFEQFDSNTISDALDFLGLPGATVGLRPLWDCPKIVGRASTVQLGRKTFTAPAVHLITPVVVSIRTEDRVLVIAGGLEGISCWGDILANAAQVKKIRGTVIDGMSRDIDGSASIGYPVYGRGVTMVSARNRVVQVDSGPRRRLCDRRPVRDRVRARCPHRRSAGPGRTHPAPAGRHGAGRAQRPLCGGGHARHAV
jgi:regulator of RNase E activity RraA